MTRWEERRRTSAGNHIDTLQVIVVVANCDNSTSTIIVSLNGENFTVACVGSRFNVAHTET